MITNLKIPELDGLPVSIPFDHPAQKTVPVSGDSGAVLDGFPKDCLFPQPEFKDCGGSTTGDCIDFVCSNNVRAGYDYRDFSGCIDATYCLPRGGHQLVKVGASVYASAETSRGL